MTKLLPSVVFTLFAASASLQAAVQCPLEFAPLEGVVKAPEHPWRQELCLNGLWQFHPVSTPKERTEGIAPELAPPSAEGWSPVPLKIPSHWNVNNWGGGRPSPRKEKRLYWPDSIYFPSYPAQWDRVEMGWLKRSFRPPDAWPTQRLILHFEAVAGECQVWVNGKKLKEHFDNYLPFEIDVTEHLRKGTDNELLVGIRGANLFNKTSSQHPKFSAVYPPGSVTDGLIGIWQDVFLLSLPRVHVAEAFVKPLVKEGVLEAEVILLNRTGQDQTVEIKGEINPWTNLAGKEMLQAPERKWRLEPPILHLQGRKITLKAGQETKVLLRQPVQEELKFWSPKSPNLYGLVLSVSRQGQVIDRHYTRFGWRELAIQGPDLLLNGEKIKLMGDWAHPFGAYLMTPRYVWAWYQLIKDFGGNSLRPHAQIHPRFFLDLADEMGLLLLEETAIFGSSVRLNPLAPGFWDRCAFQYDGMVKRDRNHPCVFGWSFANEMFAIPELNKMSKEETKAYDEKVAELGRRSLSLDPTRTWITCDGDGDLEGALPVWSKHFGHGYFVDKLPKNLNKPLVVGESGGAYYASPEQLSVFNGDRAYESYLGRNEALAIDLYDNIVQMALPHLAHFSPRQTVWWGTEHLNLGYDDFSRMPTLNDGVFFTRAFVEGKPGMQPERIPPFVTTLNPGWDPALPLYKPLPVFHALKAALAPGGPAPCPWDHKVKLSQPQHNPVPANILQIDFAGPDHSPLRQCLADWGATVAAPEIEGSKLLVVDAQALGNDQVEKVRTQMQRTFNAGGTVLLMIGDPQAPLESINLLLPQPLALTERWATSLRPNARDPWIAGLGLKDLYFGNLDGDPRILKSGLAGPLVEAGQVVLEANNTDWSLFNGQPQFAKAGAVTLFERLQKPSGAGLVRLPQDKGTLALCSLDYRVNAPGTLALWRQLLANMGVKLAESKPQDLMTPKKPEQPPELL